MFKYLKIISSAAFLILMLGSLIYSNITDPSNQSEIMKTLSKMMMPLFLLFSFSILFFKRRVERKKEGSKKLDHQDRQFYSSIGSADKTKK